MQLIYDSNHRVPSLGLIIVMYWILFEAEENDCYSNANSEEKPNLIALEKYQIENPPTDLR